METALYTPRTLQEAIVYYANEDNALAFMVAMRWPDGVTCPRCGSKEHTFLSARRIWKCKGCKKQFSVKLGTIFEDSPLKLSTWLPAVWMITNAKNGISSLELHRALGITQKSAWFVLHRIRLAMDLGTIEKPKMGGEIEADETFVGGLEANKHSEKRRRGGRGPVGKAIVMGILERGGAEGTSTVRANVIGNTDKGTLQGEIRSNVAAGSQVHTDAHPSYAGLSAGEEAYVHEVINHSVEYVRGTVTTNRIENFFSCLKRTLHGTYVSVEPYHLQAYVDEQIARFNLRKSNDAERFTCVAGAVKGKRLTWKELVARGE